MQKLFITLQDDHMHALESLMAEDMAHSKSAYFGTLIASEVKRRKADKEKRGPGRPAGGVSTPVEPAEDMPDYSDDQPKNIPHFGRMIGQQEYKDIEAAAQAFRARL